MRHRSHISEEERVLISRLQQTLRDEGLLRANLVNMRRRCGKPQCRCAKDDAAKHQSLYLSQSHQGRQRMQYVPPALHDRVRSWVERYHEVRRLLDEIADLYWQRLRDHEP